MPPYLSSTVTGIFSVYYWRNIEMCVTGRSRSLKMCHSKALVCFCRAMRCISAAYVVMQSECLSVCVSVRHVRESRENE